MKASVIHLTPIMLATILGTRDVVICETDKIPAQKAYVLVPETGKDHIHKHGSRAECCEKIKLGEGRESHRGGYFG